MESNLVSEFIAKTGATAQEAHNELQAKGWDLKLAIQDYLRFDKENTSRPVLAKSDAYDESSYKKLARGISRATDNACVVSRARCELGLDFRENGISCVDQYFIETPVYTFTLPDLSIHPDDFREFLERDLIDMSCLSSLEQAGRLNWWVDTRLCQRLWPISTTGDGNCLLHAASLGMWGFHDRLLTLRRALHEFLTNSEFRPALYRRWRWQLTRLNAEAGLVYTEDEWRREWEAIVSMASSTPRNSNRRRSMIVDKPGQAVPENATYESLEEIHVLALAHVLKRAIIIIADTMLKDVNGENLAPIMFGGTYLPIEINPTKCHKTPLVLTYDAAHFSALVAMDNVTLADKVAQPTAVIPLTDSEHKVLPLQFAIDPGVSFIWGKDEKEPGMNERLAPSHEKVISLLRSYLDICLVPLTSSPSSEEYEDFETPVDEEDIEKRFYEVDAGECTDEQMADTAAVIFNNKSRAARQLQTVAKSFGSIGKSMSKKLKNLGTITKIARGVEKKERALGDKPTNMLCARLGGETRPSYQEEMVKNYLNTARTRFERDNKGKQRPVYDNNVLESERLQQQAKVEGPTPCISPACNRYGTALTSYMCSTCYEKQRQQELNNNINSPLLPRHTTSQSYEAGKSTFYVEPPPSGSAVNESVAAKSTNVLRNRPSDEPLHINRSTFYPRDWHSNSAGRNNISTFPTTDGTIQRSTLQEVGNAIDGLGVGRYTQHRSSASQTLNENSSWDQENGPSRKIHSYNLTKDFVQTTPNRSDNGTVYCVKGTAVRTGSSNSTLTAMSPQSSQDLPEIENVHPSRATEVGYTRMIPTSGSSETGYTRIIPISVESPSKRMQPTTCFNVMCPYFGSPELENYCSKCYKGRRESWLQGKAGR